METFAKFYFQPLFFPGHPKKILFLEITQSIGVSERVSKQYTTKAFAQLNSSKQEGLKFQRLTNQTGASRWQ